MRHQEFKIRINRSVVVQHLLGARAIQQHQRSVEHVAAFIQLVLFLVTTIAPSVLSHAFEKQTFMSTMCSPASEVITKTPRNRANLQPRRPDAWRSRGVSELRVLSPSTLMSDERRRWVYSYQQGRKARFRSTLKLVAQPSRRGWSLWIAHATTNLQRYMHQKLSHGQQL